MVLAGCVVASMMAGVVIGNDAAPAAQTQPSPYEVVWDSPSANSDGTMPLGNGEVALNAWIEPSGDLRFYIARTDSWDDNGRLLKVGSVRVRVGEAAADRTKVFRQALTVRDGTMTARFGQGDSQVDLRLWVDAHRPVVCVEVQSARPAEAQACVELWRKEPFTLPSVECSDIYRARPEKTIVEPDVVLSNLKDRVGWYHRNIKSVGPEVCAKVQGVDDFARPDPLLHRTFGAVIAASRAERVDDLTLKSKAGTTHLFEIAVNTKHPATAEDWLKDTQRILDEAQAVPLVQRRTAHEKWWADFWDRSYIHITPNGLPVKMATEAGASLANKHPVRIGIDQSGGSKFSGTLGRVGVYDAELTAEAIGKLAAAKPADKAPELAGQLYSEVPAEPKALADLARCTFEKGVSVEAWVKFDAQSIKREMRIVDKISVGGSDGFLLDVHPAGGLRAIVGKATVSVKNVLAAGEWQHVAMTADADGHVKIYRNGKPVMPASSAATAAMGEGSDAFVVSRGYALQRYVNACAGRGNHPIKYNGSLFTVPSAAGPGDADFRKWGPGYWWQNTRLPYIGMCASGDFEMMAPLFKMYGRDLMPLFKHRTKKYLQHEGAYIPECIYFWGDMFTETYGWQPWNERADKLQASGWHKWEWVSGLELTALMLDYYDHTQDGAFLKDTALPVAHEILTFFDQQYKTDANGKLVMHPSQACETWWDCTNPMPELAGLHAVTARLLGLPESATSAGQREFWNKLQARLPALPTTIDAKSGKPMLAPAEVFKKKSNIENPELYAVFPFRLIAIDKPNIELGTLALDRRLDRGPFGWRQEDIFMAYLGLADAARDYVVKRARSKHAASRFPAFWGPNYDWVPDQDHGGVLVKAVQSLLMQTDGRKIYLLPAWPGDWDAEFRLHAPYNTTVSGKVEKGKLVLLDVQPESRRADVKVWTGQ